MHGKVCRGLLHSFYTILSTIHTVLQWSVALVLKNSFHWNSFLKKELLQERVWQGALWIVLSNWGSVSGKRCCY